MPLDSSAWAARLRSAPSALARDWGPNTASKAEREAGWGSVLADEGAEDSFAEGPVVVQKAQCGVRVVSCVVVYGYAVQFLCFKGLTFEFYQ